MGELTMAEKAVGTLVDYLCLLRETNPDEDSGFVNSVNRPSRRKHHRSKIVSDPITCASEVAVREADKWIAAKERSWRSVGKLTTDGQLKTGGCLPDWTDSAVATAFPALRRMDRLAVLVELDGLVEAGCMAERTRIREVVNEIVDLRVARLFREIMREIGKQGRASVPAPVLTGILRPSGGGPGGARRRKRRDGDTGEMLTPQEYDRRQQLALGCDNENE